MTLIEHNRKKEKIYYIVHSHSVAQISFKYSDLFEVTKPEYFTEEPVNNCFCDICSKEKNQLYSISDIDVNFCFNCREKFIEQITEFISEHKTYLLSKTI